ncbi:hypothetical protein DFH09DRAFT_1275674 [Mycena vulgaris]|nr:hypothetical protein DFH09DRAFT_1275674 [Mycena vulgaris]
MPNFTVFGCEIHAHSNEAKKCLNQQHDMEMRVARPAQFRRADWSLGARDAAPGGGHDASGYFVVGWRLKFSRGYYEPQRYKSHVEENQRDTNVADSVHGRGGEIDRIGPLAATGAVLDTERSVIDLAKLRDYLFPPPGRHRVAFNDYLLLLPVVYALSDPGNIGRSILPPESPLHDLDGLQGLYAFRAGVALELLAHIAEEAVIPPDAMLDLWPRIWSWMESRCHLLDVLNADAAMVSKMSIDHIALLSQLLPQQVEASHSIISDTPELRFVATRAWKWTTHEVGEHRDVIFKLMDTLILAEEPTHFEELLIIEQLTIFASDISSYSRGQHYLLDFILTIVTNNPKFHACLMAQWTELRTARGNTGGSGAISAILLGLARLERALVEFGDSSFTLRLREIDMWATFFVLVDGKLEIKRNFDATYQSTRFCDNADCNKVLPKAEFKRCSQCITVVPFACDISTKGKAFLRHLIHCDYRGHKEIILGYRKDFLMTSDGPFYSQFDYSGGDVSVEVLPPDRLRSLLGDVADFYLARMERSGGRMQLDVVMGAQGAIMYPWIFPMRSSNGDLHNGLLGVVAGAKAGDMSAAEQYRSVRALIADLLGVCLRFDGEMRQPEPPAKSGLTLRVGAEDVSVTGIGASLTYSAWWEIEDGKSDPDSRTREKGTLQGASYNYNPFTSSHVRSRPKSPNIAAFRSQRLVHFSGCHQVHFNLRVTNSQNSDQSDNFAKKRSPRRIRAGVTLGQFNKRPGDTAQSSTPTTVCVTGDCRIELLTLCLYGFYCV